MTNAGKIRETFENPEREPSSLAVLGKTLGDEAFAHRGDRGVRTAFDRVGNALTAAAVEVIKEPALPDDTVCRIRIEPSSPVVRTPQSHGKTASMPL